MSKQSNAANCVRNELNRYLAGNTDESGCAELEPINEGDPLYDAVVQLQDGAALPSEGKSHWSALLRFSRERMDWELIRQTAHAFLDWIEKEYFSPTPTVAGNDHAISDDGCSLKWFGETYTFTQRQAPAVKVLYENWTRGTPDTGTETLANAIDHASPPNLKDAFRRSTAWNTLIVDGRARGTKRLKEPESDG